MSTTKTAPAPFASRMREASKKQAAVHQKIAAETTTYDGTGSVDVTIVLFGGSISCSFNINGANYAFEGKCATGGVAWGTSTGSIICLINPQDMVGDLSFNLACSGSGTGVSFYQDGVMAATFNGDGIHGGAGATGGGTWSSLV